MKIHEYQAKDLFRQFSVPIPAGSTVGDPAAARAAAEAIGSWPVVIKAQVHAGGRGKAGGVKLARSGAEAEQHARAILGMDIKGNTVHKVLVEQAADIRREIYLGVIMDRATKGPVIMASAAGGIDIEEVAAHTPEKILFLPMPPFYGLKGYHIVRLATFLEIPASAMKSFKAIVTGLMRIFYEKDCSLAEINPLVITGSGDAIACDGKVNFDENALFKHPDLEQYRDETQEEPLEVQARKKSINYVKLSGKIGCIVNGAGLAMATMDMVKYFGGEPANFLDIGGGAKAQQVKDALELITSDPAVNTIFFNIFGGIVRTNLVVEGILQALATLPDFNCPIVIRLIGTNDREAKEMMKGTQLHVAETMADGARMAVELSRRPA
jgi:succinyl-CoA synthetase beta subunit